MQHNKVLIFTNMKIKIIKINVQVVMPSGTAVDLTPVDQVQGALEIIKVLIIIKSK